MADYRQATIQASAAGFRALERPRVKKYSAATKLRAKKVDEIRELLAMPPDPSDEEAVKFIAWWRETGQVSVPAQLKTKAQLLLRQQ